MADTKTGRDEQHATRTRCYQNGELSDEGFPLEQVSEHLAEPEAVVWIDLCKPDAREVQVLGEELGLHALAIEDALQRHQRPKLDRYGDHAFLSAYAVRFHPDSGRVEVSEIAAFLTERALITVRGDDEFDIDAVVQRWDEAGGLAKHGVGFLVHGLLDYLVDGHFSAVESLDEQIESLEDLLFADATDQRQVQRRSFTLRKSLVLLRRVVLPMREVVNGLLRRENGYLDDAMEPYFQDVYDHVLRATEWTESLRDLVTTVLETNLTLQGNRLNVITKQVTSWAAIIAVPTAITGFYGQNVPYPGYDNTAGFVASSVLIVVMSGLLYWAFRRRGWL